MHFTSQITLAACDNVTMVPKLQDLVYDIPASCLPWRNVEEGAGKRCSKCARYPLTALLSLNSLDVSVSCRTKTGSFVTPLLCDPVGIHRHGFRLHLAPPSNRENAYGVVTLLLITELPRTGRSTCFCCLKVEAWLPPRG